MKRLVKLLIAVSGVLSILLSTGQVLAEESQQTQRFRVLTVDEIVEEMGTGINLGNTFDAHTGLEPNETLWQNVRTNQHYMNAVHDYGLNTIRIPVTWGKMIGENYEIDEAWINRVQDVVDYAISQDMYVILNIHHDGAEQSGWLLVESDQPEKVLADFAGVWRSIATHFKDYDEHLIFESMNEVWGHTQTIQEDMKMINQLNQVFVDTVRDTGGNNDQRFLCVPGRYTNIDVNTDEKNGFKVPVDSVDNRIFVSVHDYPMGMGLTESMGATQYSEIMAQNYINTMQKLIDAFTSKGIPVILGEYGTMNKHNTVERAYYYEVINRYSAVAGVVPVAWDMGAYDLTMDPDYSMTLIDRETGEAIYPTIIEAILRGINTDVTELTLDGLVKPTADNPTPIIPIETITVDTESVSMVIDEKLRIDAGVIPSDTNEALLWRTNDPYVATVSDGRVIGRGIGETELTVFSASGAAEKIITVTVLPMASDIPCDSIVVNSSITVEAEGFGQIYASNGTKGSTDFLTYRSSDPSIATVNRFGKVVGINPGATEVVITASSGLSKSVKVTVREKVINAEISLALYVYYNDSVNNYFGNEQGEVITVNGDGTYRLVFDTNVHLSTAAKGGAITGLSHVGAIYIKDVESGNVLETTNILYKEVIVDGQSLTVVQTEPKPALKASGIFDTNDPINAWDGSQVAEVAWDQKNFTVNFTDMDNPQTIEVIFELSDMKFIGASSSAGEGTLNLYSEPSVDESQEEEVSEDQETETIIKDAETEKTEENSEKDFTILYMVIIVVLILAGGFIVFKVKKKA